MKQMCMGFELFTLAIVCGLECRRHGYVRSVAIAVFILTYCIPLCELKISTSGIIPLGKSLLCDAQNIQPMCLDLC